MKRFSQTVSIILAAVMLLSVLAACSGSSGGAGQKDSAQSTEAPAIGGETQTWGEITVTVPADMRMQGGDGTFDPDDQKTLWLYDTASSMKYMKVTIVDSEDSAASDIGISKSVNEDYSPVDVTLSAGGEWKGISYDANGTPCCSMYATIGDKVFYVMMAGEGYAYDSEKVKSILSSLK